MKHNVFKSWYSAEEQEAIITDAIAEGMLDEDASEDRKYQFLLNEKDTDYICEVDNLFLSKNVYAVGNVGLWNRTVDGFHRFNNLNEVLSFSGINRGDYEIELFVEDGILQGVVHHHDGSNYFTYYILNDNVNAEEFEYKLNETFRNENKKQIELLLNANTTNAGDYVSKLYGWDVPKVKQAI